ncbi:unnamed protein product [marine sediment metagenome]|uniref:Uncharacterized protein n=1 Tax=marine sediment metagenome TaxID=412755 RepID=X1DPL3_9ZZZZ
MSVDTIVRHLVVNVGDIDRGSVTPDSRVREISLYDGCVGIGAEEIHDVYGLEFPIHKPDRSIKATGRENVGRPGDTPAFWPSAPLTEGQDDQTLIGCAVAGTCQIAPDALGNYVQLAFIAYHPETPLAGYCVAWLNVDTDAANQIAAGRFTNMNLVACNKYIPRQSNISLVVLAGSADGIPGFSASYPGLTINGLTGQFEYEIFA